MQIMQITRRRTRIITTLILWVLISSAYSQPLSETQRRILTLQDTRSLGDNDELLMYLSSDSAEIVIMSLIALGNIADTNTADYVAEKLTDLNPAIREYAAWALGQIPCTKSAEYLSKALASEKLSAVICRILEGLGKTGSEQNLPQVCSYKSSSDTVNSFIAMSIARFGLRKIRSETCLKKLISLLDGMKDSGVLKSIAYAFNRTADEKFPEVYIDELIKLSSNELPEIRMWAYSALGRTRKGINLPYFLDSYKSESDWRVKINILNAIASIDTSETAGLLKTGFFNQLIKAIDDSNESVSLTSLSLLGKLYGGANVTREYKEFLEAKLLKVLNSHGYTFRQRSESARTLALVLKDSAIELLSEAYRNIGDWDVKAGIIRAFGNFQDGSVYKRARMLISRDVEWYGATYPEEVKTVGGSKTLIKLYRAFIETMSALMGKYKAEDKNSVRLIFSEFLTSKDLLITDLCLNALSDASFTDYLDQTRQILLFDYSYLKYPEDRDLIILYTQKFGEMKITEAADSVMKYLSTDDYELASASAEALYKITGKSFGDQITAAHLKTDFDWTFLAEMEKKKIVTMKTSRGDIKLELFWDEAMFTVQNFLKLAESGYYDRTIFHRVVPNFVIQGGDRTGTGYSGPGYSIRSEFFPATYEAGYLGMASAGKDTEGSQFFITHSPQPHLDGKYSIFGKVVSGMDVVDKIQVGDILEEVKIGN
jgi:cyclophilin family peptidyl-prolyl cis-trans isomerase/HEAT repeat protein